MAISAKAYLEETRRTRIALDKAKAALREVEAGLYYAGGGMPGLGVQNHAQTDLSDRLIRKEKYEAAWIQALGVCMDHQLGAAIMIDWVKDPRAAEVLTYHFCCNLPWGQSGYGLYYARYLARAGYADIDSELQARGIVDAEGLLAVGP